MLIAVWAVVLVPMWAQRHHSPPDVDLSPGSRVLSRRRDSSRPHRRSASAHDAARPGRPTGRRKDWDDRGRHSRRAVIRHRRITLAGLGASLPVIAVAVLLGLPAWLLLLPAALCGGCLVWLRSTAAAVAAGSSSLDGSTGVSPGFRDFGATAEPAADRAPAASEVGPGAAAVVAAASEEYDAGQPARPGDQAQPSPAPWLPVPVPLPSYVTAPPAPAVLAGDWHEEVLLDGELPGEAAAYALGDDALRRRAVGD